MSVVEQFFNYLSEITQNQSGPYGSINDCGSVDEARAAIQTIAIRRIVMCSPNPGLWSDTVLASFCDEPCAFSYTDKPQRCAICHADDEKGLLFDRSTRPQFFAGATCMTNVVVNMYLLNFTNTMEKIITDKLTHQFRLSEWLSLWNCLLELTSPDGHRLSSDTRMAMLQEYIPMYQFLTDNFRMEMISDSEDDEPAEPAFESDSSDDESTGIELVETPPAPKRQRVADSSDDESTGIEPVQMPPAPKRQRVIDSSDDESTGIEPIQMPPAPPTSASDSVKSKRLWTESFQSIFPEIELI